MQPPVVTPHHDPGAAFTAHSPFEAYVYSTSFYRDVTLTLFKHTLGALAAAQLDMHFGRPMAELMTVIARSVIVTASNAVCYGLNRGRTEAYFFYKHLIFYIKCNVS